MSTSSASNAIDASGDILVQITEALQACGLEPDEYQLYDYVAVEALERIVDSSREDLEVQFSVQGIRLAVTAENVDVLVDSHPRSAEQS